MMQHQDMRHVRPFYVGVCGYKGAGKDTAATRLVERWGFERRALADPLKQAAAAIFGFTPDQLYGDLKEAVDPYWNLSPRQVLQWLGTEGCREAVGGRAVESGAWSEDERNGLWIRALDRACRGLPRVVVPDVRYANEARAILMRGGVLIRVDRPGHRSGSHKSEQLDQWWEEFAPLGRTRTLQNDADIRSLHVAVDDLLELVSRGRGWT